MALINCTSGDINCLFSPHRSETPYELEQLFIYFWSVFLFLE